MKPIIIVGMHRSGTSLLSSLLQDMGIFMGHSRDKNEESRFFLKANHWILNQISASWDDPQNMNYANQEFYDAVSLVLANQIDSIYSKYKYFGPTKMWTSSFKKEKSWGWKDPRNTFTLPIWLELFPDAEVIGIYRNPWDTILSMNKREHQKVQALKKKKFKGDWKSYFYKGKISNASFRLLDEDNCFQLWKAYNEKMFEHQDKIKLLIKYEDLLEDPLPILQSIQENLSQDFRVKPNALTTKIDSSRAYAFSNDNPKLIALKDKVNREDIVKQLGYDNLI